MHLSSSPVFRDFTVTYFNSLGQQKTLNLCKQGMLLWSPLFINFLSFLQGIDLILVFQPCFLPCGSEQDPCSSCPALNIFLPSLVL